MATRGADGWTTTLVGPTGDQVETPFDGGNSSDLKSFFIFAKPNTPGEPNRGSLVAPYGSDETTLIRLPDGSYDLVGRGPLGQQPNTTAYLITPGAGHILFGTVDPEGNVVNPPIQLTPDAPPSGTVALYDRPNDGPPQVLSLLPGNVTPAAGQNAVFQGASEDGAIVAFKFSPEAGAGGTTDPPLYVRAAGQTDEVTANANSFAGIYGGQVFYADTADNGGAVQTPADLFSFDPATQQTTQITNVADAVFVNVAADGSRVYFVSDSQIGGQGTGGQPNLYLWDRASNSTTFVATVSPTDVTGDLDPNTFDIQNMSAWQGASRAAQYDNTHGRAIALNRTTPDGSVLVFESVAQLTSFSNAGHSEIYRYDASSHELECISCSGPQPPDGDSQLQSISDFADFVRPLSAIDPAQNVTQDGNTVAFESSASLLPNDSNGKVDVYRWTKGQGLALISTGHATSDSYLYGMTPDGSNIFFDTPQSLVPLNQNGSTPALYDARIDGGIASQFDAAPQPCVADACQGGATLPPPPSIVATAAFSGPGNVTSGSANPAARARVLTRTARGASFVVKVKAPGPGRITMSGASIRRVSRSVANAGTYRLHVRLTRKASRALAHDRELKITLRVRYEAGARTSVANAIVTVRPALRRKGFPSDH